MPNLGDGSKFAILSVLWFSTNTRILCISFINTQFTVTMIFIFFLLVFSPPCQILFPSFTSCSHPLISHSIRVYSSWPLSCFHFPLLSQSSILHPPHSRSLSPPLSVSLSRWVPAAKLVGLVAGVTARLSGVACDQGGRRAARTIGAERLRLTAGHLSRAISVGAEALLPLVGPVYCEDQRQSVSTLHSALFPLLLSHFCLQPLTLSSPCLSALLLYLFEFSPDVLLQLSG